MALLEERRQKKRGKAHQTRSAKNTRRSRAPFLSKMAMNTGNKVHLRVLVAGTGVQYTISLHPSDVT